MMHTLGITATLVLIVNAKLVHFKPFEDGVVRHECFIAGVAVQEDSDRTSEGLDRPSVSVTQAMA
jgi:hypothetical protein